MAGLVALLIGMAVLVGGCGGSAGSAGGHAHANHPAGGRSAAGGSGARRAARTVPAPVRLVYRPLYALPAPLRDPATAPLPEGRFVMLGGLDAADVSTDEIDVASLHGLLHSSVLPLAQHDAQAATLAGRVYVFGGGAATELSHILRFDPAGGPVAQVGTLSVAQSDVAVTQAGGTAYVVGGFDGTDYLNTVVAWRPGRPPQVQARLPVGLRYAAVAAADGGLLILGGSTPGGASDAIYRFDLATHRVRRLGTLRHPVTHANAAALGSTVYLVGGRGDALDSQTPDVWAIDSATGRVRAAGRLPGPVSDAGVTAVGDAIVVAGGLSSTATLSRVGKLVPAAAP